MRKTFSCNEPIRLLATSALKAVTVQETATAKAIVSPK